MNALDIFFLAMIGLGVWRGYRGGLAKQMLTTIGLFFAFIIGAALMEPIGSAVVERIGFSERAAPVVGFIVIFSGVLGAVAGLGVALRKTLEAAKLSSVDTLGGSLLGGVKAALSLSIFLLISGFSPSQNGEPWLIGGTTREASVLYEPIEAVAPETWALIQSVTPGIQEALLDKFNSWQDGRRESTPTVLTRG